MSHLNVLNIHRNLTSKTVKKTRKWSKDLRTNCLCVFQSQNNFKKDLHGELPNYDNKRIKFG